MGTISREASFCGEQSACVTGGIPFSQEAWLATSVCNGRLSSSNGFFSGEDGKTETFP
jgi:hypothetical protein